MSNENKKIALVTGGNRGIGLETVKQPAEKGYKVLLGARNEEKGLEAESEFKNKGLDVEFIKLDLGDSSTFAAAAKTIEEKYGKLDALVNNAAISIDEQNGAGFVGASKTSSEVFRKTFDVNFLTLSK